MGPAGKFQRAAPEGRAFFRYREALAFDPVSNWRIAFS